MICRPFAISLSCIPRRLNVHEVASQIVAHARVRFRITRFRRIQGPG
jgi:hypothetical protein